jgi:NAD+ diphosphatase
LQREVQEEVGVLVRNPRYFGSQSWPFPGNLMLGFHADYASGDIVLQEDEIAEAAFFHFSDLPPIPPPGSIAHALIQDFVARCRRSRG